jgi:hypothetical protein
MTESHNAENFLLSSLRTFGALTLIAIALCAGTTTTHAYMEGYTPLNAADKRSKISLKTVSDAGLKDGKVLKIAGAEMSLPKEGDNIVFTGRDANGKKWTFSKYYFGLGTAFFTKDLDQNGVEDIILLQATGGCGIAPAAVLTTILFDKQLRPFPFETSGYFSTADKDWGASSKTAVLDDIFTIGSDRRANIVCNQLASAQIEKTYHSYWRNIVYRVNNGRWEKLPKYHEKNNPMYVRYTFKSNLKVIPPPVAELNTYEDGSFTKQQEANCKTAPLSEVRFNKDGKIDLLRFGKETFADSSNWGFFQCFVIHETGDSLDISNLDCEQTQKFLKESAERKCTVRYSRPAMKGKFPLYTWVIDPQ